MSPLNVNEDPDAPRVLAFHLSGLRPAGYRPEEVAGWLGDARAKLIDPLREAWFGDKGVAAAEGGPAGTKSSLTFHAFRRRRPVKLVTTQDAWERMLRDLTANKLDSAVVHSEIRPPANEPSASWIEVSRVEVLDPVDSISGSATLTGRFTGHEPYWDVSRQQEYIRAWLDLARRLDAPLGHATLDIAAGAFGTTPHERLTGSFFSDYETLARGYHWGTLLSDGHVAALGGPHAVIRFAPVHRIEQFESAGGRHLMYLELTPDMRQYSDEQLLGLKDFMRPILRPENPEITYFGNKPRFVPDM